MRKLGLLISILSLPTALGCDQPDNPQDTGESDDGSETDSGTDTSSGSETGETGETGEPEDCSEPLDALPIDHDLRFSGFPEIDGEMIVDLDSNSFDYMGNCTVLSAGPVGPINEVVFACEHPESDTAEVTLALDGVALPAGLEVNESVELRISADVNVGGLVDELEIESAGPKPWLLMVGYQEYEIRDADGLVFAAMHGLSGFAADYGELTLSLEDECPSYEFGDSDIAAFFRASTSEASVDVPVGEAQIITLGDAAWYVKTFRAQRSCCHGDLADVRVLRTAP